MCQGLGATGRGGQGVRWMIERKRIVDKREIGGREVKRMQARVIRKEERDSQSAPGKLGMGTDTACHPVTGTASHDG